jgi:hypothetical protein
MELPKASKEQIQVNELINNYNVVVDSVAGSGKTTCNLHLAKKYPKKNMLLLTYNAKLKLDTREKINELQLGNIEAHSYHSFCVKYYNRLCYTDTVITQVIKTKTNPVRHFDYDIIIIDEAQDMSILYYELICKVYKDNGNDQTKLVILGDQFQGIFTFNGADERHITLATKIFKMNKFEWKTCNLSQSFRITQNNSKFVNECMLGFDRIQSYKMIGEKNVTYLQCDSFGDKPFEMIENYLTCGYKPEDIFILAPSLRSAKTPARLLENKIKTCMSNVPVFVPVSDEEKLDADTLRNKLVFSTFHQVKGLERKIVMVYSFDCSYFKFYNKDANPNVCPNEMYVAMTRALEKTVVIHQFTNDHLDFLNVPSLKYNCDYKISRRLRPRKIKENNNLKISVTDVIRHLPSHIIDECYSKLKVTKLYSGVKVNVKSKVEQPGGFETVNEITGVAIPSYFEYLIKGTMSIYELLIKNDVEIDVDNTERKEEPVNQDDMDMLSGLFGGTTISESSDEPTKKYSLDDIDLKKITPDELLFVANKWNTYKNGYLFKIYQISNYNWLTFDHMKKFIPRMNKLKLTKECIFEQQVSVKGKPELINRTLSGYVDCINGNDVYEFKCVSKLTKEHYLQLAIYMYILNDNTKTYYLYNVINDSLNRVDYDQDALTYIIKILFEAQYLKKDAVLDEEFINNALEISARY